MRTIVSCFAMSGGWAQNGIGVFILMIYGGDTIDKNTTDKGY